MAFPDGSEIVIGGARYVLDHAADEPYVRWSREINPDTSGIIGQETSVNLVPQELRWDITNFDGEGQVVLDTTNPASARRFYRSEGLDFRVPGQFQLNRSTVLQRPLHTGGGGTATLEGNAGYEDITGTSTASGTDRRLNVINDVIGLATDRTPGAGTVQVDFYAFHEEPLLTTTQGSSFDRKSGSGEVSGDDFTLRTVGTIVGTAAITGLTAGIPYEVNYYAYSSAAVNDTTAPYMRFQVWDVTSANNPFILTGEGGGSSAKAVTATSAGTLVHRAVFTPQSGRSYEFRFTLTNIREAGSIFGLADKVTYGPALSTNNAVTLTVFNVTGAATVVSKTVTLTATAAGSLIGSLTYVSAATTDYDYRVTYTSGSQRPWLDKVIETIQTSGSDLRWDPEILDLGQGGNVWLAGKNTAAAAQTWTYDFSNNDWDARVALGASGKIPLAMAHTDAFQYTLLDDKIVYQHTTSAANAYIAATTATARGCCIAQDRLFVLGEDSTNGTIMYLYPVDATSLPVAITNTLTITTAKSTPDITLRQRMAGTPTGARFFLNYADDVATIYECDSSPSTPTRRVLATLPAGVKATAIVHSDGFTFIAGQFKAETGQTARSALWVILPNGVLQFDGYLRRDDPNGNHVQMMRVYQGDLWLLQGPFVWRRSLKTGGLFLEYQLQPATAGNHRALAVVQGHQFAAFDEGIWVTGSVGTYRQSGPSTSGQYVSSITDLGYPGTRKVLRSIETITDDIDSGGQVKVEYQKDNDGTWVHVGTFNDDANNIITIGHDNNTVRFNTLQVRATLGSANGTATPVVKAIVVRAIPIQDEDFLDLSLLLTDEDSIFRVGERQLTGGELAANLWNLKNTGQLVTVLDGYFYKDAAAGGAPQFNAYVAKVAGVRQSNRASGEGTALVRLKILGAA